MNLRKFSFDPKIPVKINKVHHSLSWKTQLKELGKNE